MSITLTRKSVVAAITPTAPGAGYTQALTTIALTGNATGHPVVALDGTITSYVIDLPGDNYDIAPGVTVTGDGTGATATASITDGSLYILRKQFLQDFYDGTTSPITALSPYNLVARANFFSDTALQSYCDQVCLEEADLLLPYSQPGSTNVYPANALDPATALYKLIRIRAWQLALTNAAYLKAIFSGGTTQDVVQTTINQMQAQMRKDRIYATRATSLSPGGFELQRG